MNTLFELRSDEDMRNEAIADNQRRIHEAVIGHGPWELTERQRKLLECLRGRQGRLHAVSIAELAAKVGAGQDSTKVDARSIKADIRELVIGFRLPIVASRDSEDGGYFFAVTGEERISGTADYVKEIVALAERVRIIRNVHDIRTLFGQISNELKPAESEAR